jgi:hypothetical protein
MSENFGLCPVGGIWKRDFLTKSISFFPTLIFELHGAKSDETWTKWSPQHKKQVFKRGFSQIQRYPFRFWMNSKN